MLENRAAEKKLKVAFEDECTGRKPKPHAKYNWIH